MVIKMLNEYPRPQFRRSGWINLNGAWRFAFDDQRAGESEKWYCLFPAGREINVPYTYETKMSGIGDETFHPVVWYQKTLQLGEIAGRLLIHFEGSDYITKVWLNGRFIGSHAGAYAAFSLDLTDAAAAGDNNLTVCVEDSKSCLQPRGKQRWRDENYGCWYVQTTGIWKTVWLEPVPEYYIEKVKITPDIDTATVKLYGTIRMPCGGGGSMPCGAEGLRLRCRALLKGQVVTEQTVTVDQTYVAMTLSLADEREQMQLALWHPDHPDLYDLELALLDGSRPVDAVDTYVGMRKISISGSAVFLNNRPIYQRLILDQGYWEDSHLTPPSDSAYETDLDLILKAGYNGLRKHQKTEDRRFLYLCDKKGVLVWSEMAAQFTFNDDVVTAFTREWMEIVEQNYNHPSVVVWTPFNESWGIERVSTDARQQSFTKCIYYLTKAFDPMRPVITNDGWEHTISDIVTLHDYEEDGQALAGLYGRMDEILGNRIMSKHGRFAMAGGHQYKGQPVIMSEYGGIAFASEKGWGYGEQVKDEDAFISRFRNVTRALLDNKAICGFCYTQITDVQQEVNGLYTERREPKVNIGEIRKINMGK